MNSSILKYTVKPPPREAIIERTGSDRQPTLTGDLQKATQLQSSGQLQAAGQLLQKILQQAPEQPQALHLLAIVTHQLGNTSGALPLIEKAIELAPDNALFVTNSAEMRRLTGDIEQAVKLNQQAIYLDDSLAIAHSNLGIAYYDQEQMDLAEQCQLRALQLQPNTIAALNNLGSVYRSKKQLDQAIQQFEKVLAIAPNHIESINNLGAVLTENDQAAGAIKYLHRAIELNPNYADAYSNLGQAQLGLDQHQAAQQAYEKALSLDPDNIEASIGIAKILQEQEKLAEAITLGESLLANYPEKKNIYSLLAGLYTELGDYNKAEQRLEQLLTLDPNSATALAGKSHIQLELGHIAAAEQLSSQAFEADPDSIAPAIQLAQAKKTQTEDKHFKALQAFSTDIATMSDKRASSLQFALGKCYDDLQDFDQAFNYFNHANQLKRKTLSYNAKEIESNFSAIKAIINQNFVEKYKDIGPKDNTPIFILGMPRSGTTLTEQIISSHPKVFGAGELQEWLPGCYQLNKTPDEKVFPNNFQSASGKQLQQLGTHYLTAINKLAPKTQHITDKMPSNFLALGVIACCLPNAKIIHVQRNPVDTCLSCYTKQFNRGQEFSYDLQELGHYYYQYHQLMNHWRDTLPAGSFMEIQYEELVADNQAQAKKLIDYCKLEWDAACLDFYNNKRSIKTASATQVRQPLYHSSIERWRNYEKHLGPLLEALKELAPKLQ